MALSFWVEMSPVSREPVCDRLLKVCNKIFLDAESNFESMECDRSANLGELHETANSESINSNLESMFPVSM